MTYNFTNISRINTTAEFIQTVNTSFVQGWLGVVILAVVFLIFFIAFEQKTQKPIKSLTAAGFIAFGMSLFLAAMGILPAMAIFICILVVALGAAFGNLD